jgi:hypothetical protein
MHQPGFGHRRGIGEPYDFAACDPDFALLGCGCDGLTPVARNCVGCIAGVFVLAGHLRADLELSARYFPYRERTFFSCGNGDDDPSGYVRDDWDCWFCSIQIRSGSGVGRTVVSADGDISVGLLSREYSAGDLGAVIVAQVAILFFHVHPVKALLFEIEVRLKKFC